MNRCPGCGYLLPEGWSSCRKCGSELSGGAQPAPAAVGASGAVGTHSATSAPAPAPPTATLPPPPPVIAPPVLAPPVPAAAYPVVTPSTAPRVGARGLLTPAPPKPVATPVTEEQLRSVGTVPQSLLPNQRARRRPAPAPQTAPQPQGIPTPHAAPPAASPEGMRDTMMPVAMPAVIIRSQAPRVSTRQRSRLIRIGCATFAVMVAGIAAGRFQPSPKGDAAVMKAHATAVPSATRANLRLIAAVDATRHYFLEHGTFESVHLKDLRKHESGLNWRGASSDAGTSDVSVDVTGDASIVLASRIDANTCAFARDVPTEARMTVTLSSGGECRAKDAPEAGWSQIDDLL